MATLTRKIQIIPDGDFNGTYTILKDWRYYSSKLANLIMSERYSIAQKVQTMLREDDTLNWGDCERVLLLKRISKYAGKVTLKTIYSSFGYCLSKEPEFSDNLASAIRSKIDKMVAGHYADDVKKGLLKGNVALRTYKRDKMAIYLPSGNGASKFTLENNEYYFTTINKLKFKVNLGRDKSNNKLVIDKLISGEYKMPDVNIKIIDNKLFVLAPITIEPNIRELDMTISVGVDLGISVPAVCALNEGKSRAFIGSGKELMNYRFYMARKRRELQKNISLSTGGRGRAKKLKALNRVKNIESNWAQTKNHQISKKIIDFALTNNAGCIKLELLEGFGTEHKDNMVLKNWTYFQLGEMIKYKAKQEGIIVVYVDPYHTSQTCSVCGNYEKGQRINQAVFKCLNPDCKSNKKDYGTINADYNAAVNIAKSDKLVSKKEECQYNILKKINK